jgi:hypothetical protein
MAVLAEGVKRALQSTGRRRLYTRSAGWDWAGVRFLLAEDGDPLQEQWARRDIFGFESQAAGLAVHIPSAQAGGLREQLDIVDFADRLRIGLETEPRIVEISKCEPLPLGNRAGRRMRKRRCLRSGTRNGFRPQNAQPRLTPSKLFQSSATRWVPSHA